MQFKIIKSDPKIDPTHPDSELSPRHPGDAIMRLARKYGIRKALQLFGLMMSIAYDTGAVGLMSNQQLWSLANDLKAVGLMPNDLKPGDLGGETTKKLFVTSLGLGMTARQVVDTFTNGTEKAEK